MLGGTYCNAPHSRRSGNWRRPPILGPQFERGEDSEVTVIDQGQSIHVNYQFCNYLPREIDYRTTGKKNLLAVLEVPGSRADIKCVTSAAYEQQDEEHTHKCQLFLHCLTVQLYPLAPPDLLCIMYVLSLVSNMTTPHSRRCLTILPFTFPPSPLSH